MSKYLVLDADAIVNAINAGIVKGDPAGMLNQWKAYAQSIGAEIVITDVVADEVGFDNLESSQGAALKNWMDSFGITRTDTQIYQIYEQAKANGSPLKDSGELSIFDYLKENSLSANDVAIVSDNKAQFNNSNFWSEKTSYTPEAINDFMWKSVANTSDMLNISSTALDHTYQNYSEWVEAYETSNRAFNSEYSGNGYNPSQKFLNSQAFEAVNSLVSAADGSGPPKFGGLNPETTEIRSTSMALAEAIGTDINSLKGVLAGIGHALIAADILHSAYQASQYLAEGNNNAAGQVLSELAGRITLGVEGAMIGDLAGTALGAFAGDAISIGAAMLIGAEYGGELGAILGPLGGLIGGLAGAIAGGYLGTEAGRELWKSISAALDELLHFFGDLAPPAGIPSSAPTFGDPLVLDLAGAGINLSSLSGSSAHFDYSGSGFAVHTGWIKAGQGLLVLDDGQNDAFVTAAEMLGALSGNGFGDLAALDSNGDGVVDAQDAAFGRLRVWVDSNLDGTGQSGELHTLAELGILSLSVANTLVHQGSNGNTIVAKGTFTVDTGNGPSTHVMAEVNFATDRQETVYIPPPDFMYDPQALTLPDLAGFGTFPDLKVAMSLDADLLEQVQSLVMNSGTLSRTDFDDAFQTMVQRWAGAADLDPSSRGPYVDARHMAVIEAFYGIGSSDPAHQQNPNWHNGPAVWEPRYRMIIDALEVRFAAQIAAAQLMNGVDAATIAANPYVAFMSLQYDPVSNDLSGDLTGLMHLLSERAPADSASAAIYWEKVFPLVADLRYDYSDQRDFAGKILLAGFASNIPPVLQTELVGQLGYTLIDHSADAGAIVTSAANAFIVLGSGNKSISGGSNDFYLYTGGNDTIAAGGSQSELLLTGLESTDVSIKRLFGSNHLVILNEETGETLVLDGYFASGTMAKIRFADGVVYSKGDIPGVLMAEAVKYALSSSDAAPAQKHDALLNFGFDAVIDASAASGPIDGTMGGDAIILGNNGGSVSALSGNDFLVGGKGNDTLIGGAGADTYVYTAGGGNDVIKDGTFYDSSIDKLILGAGLTAEKLTIGHIGSELTLTFAGQPGSIQLIGQDGGPGGGVEQIVFGDGTIWTSEDLEAAYIAQQEAADATTIIGFDGRSDVLIGTTGADTLSGGGGNDTLIGGLGNDSLVGGVGSDTYVYAAGGGSDIIVDTGIYDNAVDKLKLSGITASDVTLVRDGADLALKIGNDTVLLKGELGTSHGQGVEQILFSDGTVWTQSTLNISVTAFGDADGDGIVQGTAQADNIDVKGGKVLRGGAGSDTYAFGMGYGNETIEENPSSTEMDAINLKNLNLSDVALYRVGNDLRIDILASGEKLLVKSQFQDFSSYGVELIHFSDGTTLDRHQVELKSVMIAKGDMPIVGTDGNDVILAAGSYFIDSKAGSDKILYKKADGALWIRDNGGSLIENDKLVLSDLNQSDLELTRVGDNLLIKVLPTGKIITVEDFFWQYGQKAFGIDTIQFANGLEWDRDQIQQNAIYRGDSGRNTIVDSSLDDVIRGGRGNDFIRIGQGSDTVIYGAGDGNDVIEHTSWSLTERDKLLLTNLNPDDVVFSREGDDILITIKATGEFIRDRQFFFYSDRLTDWQKFSYGFEVVQFADGTVWERDQIQRAAWLRGDANANTLSGSALSETFVGGQGDDIMVGSHGSDTYIWKKGDGNDRIADLSGNAFDIDTLVLEDVRSDGVSLAYQGGNVLLTIKSTGEILQLDELVLGVDNLLTDWNRNAYGIDVIKFSDGVTWDRQKIYQQIGADFIGKDIQYKYIYLETALVNAYWYDEFGHIGDITDMFKNGPDDRFSGGAGNDTLEGGGHDVLTGLGGDDLIWGNGGNDLLYGDNGDDTIFGGDDYDYLRGDSGDDILDAGDGLDWLDGGAGNDRLIGGDGKDYLSGGSGDDTIIGGHGDDVIASLDGTSTGSDTFVYALGDGNDSILDETSADYHSGQSDVLLLSDLNASELEFLHSGSDLLIKVLSTGETIRIVDQFYQTSKTAGKGLEFIHFANGEEWGRQQINQEAWYRGTDGKDTISSSSSDDNTISGGLGDDYLVSDRSGGLGTGSDTFIYAKGDGNDVIVETTGAYWHANENDILLFSDLDASDLEFSRDGDDLLVKVLSTGETIQIVKQFYEAATSAGLGLEFIRFANGEEWGRQKIYREAWYRGTGGSDIIISNVVGDNTFIGGRGNDTITSDYASGLNTGSDTYIYAKGDGNDVIRDTTQSNWHSKESDTLQLIDLNRSDLQFVRSGNDLLLNVLSTNQVVRIVDQFYESANAAGRGIETIHFANGEEWSRQTIYGAATAVSGFIAGTRFNDILNGADGQQNIYGEAGDDTLDGKAGSDLLYGGIGNDLLLISQSAAGEIDTLDGGAGIDTASFEKFSAAVWVDLATSGTEARTRDSVDLSIGTWRGIAEISTVENIIGTAFADQLFGDASANVLVGNAGADALDGRSGNDTLYGGAGSDTLTGGVDNDMLLGDEGNDSLIGGIGDDWIHGGAGIDTALFTGAWADYTITTTDGGMTVTGPDGNDTLTSVEYLAFQDRTIYVGPGNTAPTAASHSYALTQRTAFFLTAEALLQGAFDPDGDVLSISAVSASDHGLVSWTNGTDIRFTIDPAFVGTAAFTYTISDGRLGNAEGTVYLTVAPTTTVNGGAVDDIFLGLGSAETVYGNDGNDSLDGGYGDDCLIGEAGNDTLIGGIGADTLDGSAGTDTASYVASQGAVIVNLALGTGASGEAAGDILTGIENIVGSAFDDILSGDAGANSLAGGNGNDTLTGGLGADTLDGGVGFDVVSYRDASSAVQIDLSSGTKAGNADAVGDLFIGIEGMEGSSYDDKLTGDTGANILIGNAGYDTLSGGAGNDTLIGGLGNDSLIGGAGSDTYTYAAGDGSDIITDAASYDSTVDVLRLGAGLTADKVIIAHSGSDITLSFAGQTGSIQLMGEDGVGASGIEQIVFGDGSIWTRLDLEGAYIAQQQAAGVTNIIGFDQRADAITGTAGADTLSGMGGNDTLIGGLGNDSLVGGAGSDTYIYAAGDGNDIISDVRSYDSTIDRLVLGAGLTADKLMIAHTGTDLTLSFAGQSGSIQLVAEDGGSGAGIEQIVFSDGTVWTLQDLEAAYIAQQQAAGATNIVGFDLRADAIIGTTGADTLSGMGGNDTLTGGLGNDSLIGGAGADTYLYAAGDGNDVITEVASYDSTIDKLVVSDLTAANVALFRDGLDLALKIGSNIVVLKGELDTSSGQGVEQIVLSDGMVWNQAALNGSVTAFGDSDNDGIVLGTSRADSIDVTGGKTLKGGTGSDTYAFGVGYGNETVVETSGTTDVDMIDLRGLNLSNVVFNRVGNDLRIDIVSSGEKLLITSQFLSTSYGVEQVRFADGSVLTRDQFAAHSIILGTVGNDTLTGGAANDTLDGGAGNDRLSGGDGGDILIGGAGNDTLTGGLNSDTFVFDVGFGVDVITDFKAGASTDDIIQFSTALFANFAAVQAACVQSGANVVITASPGNMITLQNVNVASLHSDDFRFV